MGGRGSEGEGVSLEREKPCWRPAPLRLPTKGWEARVRGPLRPALPGSVSSPDPHCWAMRSGPVAGAQTGHPPGAGPQGLHPTHQLQPWVLGRGRRASGIGYLAPSDCASGSLGQLRATLHFLVPGARAGAACPLCPEAVHSVTSSASSFAGDSGSRACARVSRWPSFPSSGGS